LSVVIKSPHGPAGQSESAPTVHPALVPLPWTVVNPARVRPEQMP
jgi:hypothetical protein